MDAKKFTGISVMLLVLSANEASAAVIEYQPSAAGRSQQIAANVPTFGNVWEAVNQSFTAVDANILFGFYLSNYNSSSQDVTYTLREGDGNSGSILATRTLSVAPTVPSATDLFEVDFSSVTLSVGNQYTVGISPSAGGPVLGDYASVSVLYAGTGASDDTPNPYSGGQFYYSGSAYDTFFPDRDIAFRMTGVSVPEAPTVLILLIGLILGACKPVSIDRQRLLKR